jgi:hypothetical protein
VAPIIEKRGISIMGGAGDRDLIAAGLGRVEGDAVETGDVGPKIDGSELDPPNRPGAGGVHATARVSVERGSIVELPHGPITLATRWTHGRGEWHTARYRLSC